MKFKKGSFLFALAIVIAFIAFFAFKGEKTEAMEKSDSFVDKMISPGSEGIIADMEDSLKEKIKEVNTKLQDHFKKDKFCEMADLYGKDAIIITSDFKRIRGKDKIKEFWKKIKEKAKEGKKDIELRLELITVSKFLSEKMEKKDPYNAVAFVVKEINIIAEEGGETLHNRTVGYSGEPFCHRYDCQWEECEEF